MTYYVDDLQRPNTDRTVYGDRSKYFWFKNEQDALLFTLRWL